VAERAQQLGTLYGDLHRGIHSQDRVAKLARRSLFGKGG
jgi:hypothetical protein